MAKYSGRDGMLFFVGCVDILFGFAFVLLGKDSLSVFAHGAVGVPMWTGIGLLMVGIGNILFVLTSSKKKQNMDVININFGSLLLNVVGLILATCLIGFYTWGAWSVLEVGSSNTSIPGTNVTYEDAISIFTTVIIMAVLVFILSVTAMFMDCCSSALFSSGPGARDYGPPRQRGSIYDGPYGMPPQHIYKP